MNKNQSMVDIVDQYLRETKKPQELSSIVEYVAKEKDFETTDIDRINQLYLDISTSGKYVYIGDNKWDLKERNLEYWDKDGIAFLTDEEKQKLNDASDEYEDLDFSDFDKEEFIKKLENVKDEEFDDEDNEITHEDKETLEALKEEQEYMDVELPSQNDQEDEKVLDINDLDFDYDELDEEEEKYNEAMDEFEHMYDE